MDEFSLAHTGSIRYEANTGFRAPVYVRTVHKAECHHTRRQWGSLRVTRTRAREILADGIGVYQFNAGHNPPRSIWRLCGTCKPTVADIEEVAS